MTDFPGGPVVKYPPANAGDTGLVPGPGRFHMPQGNEAHAPLVSPCTESLCSTTRKDVTMRRNEEKLLLAATTESP